MKWYKDLYGTENVHYRKHVIKWKVQHNVGQLNMYLIVLSAYGHSLLEILSTVEVMQKAYPKKDLFVVGIAKGKEEAKELACNILLDIYHKTGSFATREYFLNQETSDAGRKNPCR